MEEGEREEVKEGSVVGDAGDIFHIDIYRDQLYTKIQSRILINIPRITGTLSIIGSSIILFIILRDYKHKLRHVYHRLLLIYSFIDIICSINYTLKI